MTGASDFDFEFGQWRVRHRRLKERLAGCNEWEEFLGQSQTRPTLGGNGCIEENLIHFPGGDIHAIAIRAFDPASQSWAIWWLSSANPHKLDIPVNGRFTDNVGTFLADDTHDGRPVIVRFLWLNTKSATPRWEQAMSADGGQTWETNWVMDFERV